MASNLFSPGKKLVSKKSLPVKFKVAEARRSDIYLELVGARFSYQEFRHGCEQHLSHYVIFRGINELHRVRLSMVTRIV